MTDNKIRKRWKLSVQIELLSSGLGQHSPEGAMKVPDAWQTHFPSGQPLALANALVFIWPWRDKSNIGNCPILSRGVKTLKNTQYLENTNIPTMNCVALSSQTMMQGWPLPMLFPLFSQLFSGTLMPCPGQAPVSSPWSVLNKSSMTWKKILG